MYYLCLSNYMFWIIERSDLAYSHHKLAFVKGGRGYLQKVLKVSFQRNNRMFVLSIFYFVLKHNWIRQQALPISAFSSSYKIMIYYLHKVINKTNYISSKETYMYYIEKIGGNIKKRKKNIHQCETLIFILIWYL